MYLLAPRNGVPLSSPSVSEKFEEGFAFHQVRRNFGIFSKEQDSLDTAEASHLQVHQILLRDIRDKRLLSRFTREAGKNTASAISRM